MLMRRDEKKEEMRSQQKQEIKRTTRLLPYIRRKVICRQRGRKHLAMRLNQSAAKTEVYIHLERSHEQVTDKISRNELDPRPSPSSSYSNREERKKEREKEGRNE